MKAVGKSQSLALSMTASLEGDGLLVVLPLLQAVSRGASLDSPVEGGLPG